MSGPVYNTYSDDLKTDLVANGPAIWKAERITVYEREGSSGIEKSVDRTVARMRGIGMTIYPERVVVEEPTVDALVCSVSMFLEVYLNLSRYNYTRTPSQVMFDLAAYMHGLNLSDSPNRWPERIVVSGWRPRIDPKFLVYRMEFGSTVNEEAP